MKMITYTFADGTRAAVAVEDALYERYQALRRQEENLARRERYHRDHALDATPGQGVPVPVAPGGEEHGRGPGRGRAV